MLALSGWFWLWGGSWNIIGWMFLAIILVVLAFCLYVGTWLFVRRVRHDIRRGVQSWRCRHGNHGANFFPEYDVREWFDESNWTYVTERNRYKKCYHCLRKIPGTDTVEVAHRAKHPRAYTG